MGGDIRNTNLGPIDPQETPDAMADFFKENWNLNDEEAAIVAAHTRYSGGYPGDIPQKRPKGEMPWYRDNKTHVQEPMPITEENTFDLGRQSRPAVSAPPRSMIPENPAVNQEAEAIRQYSMQKRMEQKDVEIAQGAALQTQQVRDTGHATALDHLEKIRQMHQVRHDTFAAQLPEIFGLFTGIPLGQLAQPRPTVFNPASPQGSYNTNPGSKSRIRGGEGSDI